jgi:hypothetical protein
LNQLAEQAFSVVWPNTNNARGDRMKLTRGDAAVTRVWMRVGQGGSAVVSTWLLPGAYTIAAVLAESAGSTSFAVGAVAGSSVDVTLR